MRVAVYIIIKANFVLIKLSLANIIYKGSINTWKGIIIIDMKNKNRYPLPLNFALANAYAANEHKKISNNIEHETMTKLLLNNLTIL